MDKDLLRLVIIAVGAVIILGMILWGLFKAKSKSKKINFYDNRDPLEHIDPSLMVSVDDDDFDIVPLSARKNDEPGAARVKINTRLNAEYVAEAKQNSVEASTLSDDLEHASALAGKQQPEAAPASVNTSLLPELLQLSIVARAETGLTGRQLLGACERVGLVYGSVKVFERLDEHNRVDYALASMLEPGIFPGDNWETYRCPGVTFFMQPREVDNAKEVFDDMIKTVGELSALLEGDVLDQNRQPLTAEAVQQIEASLF